MPKQVDHQHRRGQIADALWRIAARDGLAAASVRKVAAEAGVSVGMVQHYFSTKDEMLLFAIRWVGDEFGTRLVAKIGALPEPRDPHEVIRITLAERLPTKPQQRIYVQALITWLGRAVQHPELAGYLAEGTRRLRDHLADQLRLAQQAGCVADGLDPQRTADALLALTDGLSSQVLQHLYTPADAIAVLDEQLNLVFGRV